MKEALIALATVLLPSLIAYWVYIYRPKIGFETQSANAKFSVEDGKIVHSQTLSGMQVEVGTIRLYNATRADIENFEIVFERRNARANLEVYSTKNLAKSAVNFRTDPSGIFISIPRFPNKENIFIEYSIIGSSGLRRVTPKKVSGKFTIYSIVDRREFVESILWAVFFTILIALGFFSLIAIINFLLEGP